MEILVGLIVMLAVAAIPFIMPIVAFVSARTNRRRINQLEQLVEDQRLSIDLLGERLG